MNIDKNKNIRGDIVESTTFFFSNIDSDFIEKEKFACLEDFSEENEQQIYIISRPLSEKKYDYTVNKVLILLSPGYKILFVNLGLSEAEFNEIYLDFIEDLGHIADKYNYTEIISRPRYWSQFILKVNSREIFFEGISSKENLERLFEENIISDQEEQFKEIEALIKAKRTVKLLITLLIGSINSAEKLGKEPPSSILQKIKKNIILFDGDQTRFIFREKYEDKIIKLQGLAGTGKTELLLHRLKEIYTTEKNSKIILTCQSKTLANILKTRVTEFFNFMRVEEQIQWEERLWVMHSWGSTRHTYNLGTYALLCREYQLPFYSYNDCSFATACEKTLKYIKESAIEYEPIFDYILVDEGQDFTPAFIELCAMFTKEKVFVAGDIFQDIFGIQNMESEPHYLLNKCYRTDSRTLMFSHALGLGWFEDKSLRFLEDDEWHSCGYFYEDKGNSYVIKREPVKRFDEIVDIKDIPSIDILAYSGDDSREIILDTIEEIIEKYDDVEASDIVIVYPNSHLRYRKIDELELAIYKRFNLKSNLL
ncbi:hypothetical protein BK748_15455 [Bacillus thuringiensis serovar graciosensis]|nr:hypothetical protein BK748_15455 [Bacillus thuringiensis serovar graciosensis]